jgi:hypothetical protein
LETRKQIEKGIKKERDKAEQKKLWAEEAEL